MQKARIIARSGLRLRDSPRDGATLSVMRESEEVDILGRETWLRVRYKGREGFALADFVEPLEAEDESQTEFDIIHYPQSDVFKGEPLRINVDFKPAAQRIEELARASNISIWVTSSFREPYLLLSDSIVEPAKLSNHHIGHAFDMNIIFNGEILNSNSLADPLGLPEVVRQFLNSIDDDLNCRWGGRFHPSDPVHIDDGVNLRNPSLYKKKFAALWNQNFDFIPV